MSEKLWPVEIVANGEVQILARLTDQQIKQLVSWANKVWEENEAKENTPTKHTAEELSAWGTSELIELILELQEKQA